MELAPRFWDDDERRAAFAAGRGRMTVTLRAGDRTYERMLSQSDAVDFQDLKIAARFARSAEQEEQLGFADAARESWRRAAQRLFPELTDD